MGWELLFLSSSSNYLLIGNMNGNFGSSRKKLVERKDGRKFMEGER